MQKARFPRLVPGSLFVTLLLSAGPPPTAAAAGRQQCWVRVADSFIIFSDERFLASYSPIHTSGLNAKKVKEKSELIP
jgi:hypothetical protein